MKKLWNRCKGQVTLLLVLCMMMLMSGCGMVEEPDAEQTNQSANAGDNGLQTMMGYVDKAENAVDGANEAASNQAEALGIPISPTPSAPAPSQETAPGQGAVPGQEASQSQEAVQYPTSGEHANAKIEEDGTYTSAEDVALYLETYEKLPDNFMTKKEARELGWSGGSLEKYAPGMCIGGDYFGNYEGTLPDGEYHECDIDTLGAKSRGAKRIVYSEDGRIYYTEDHYETFELLYE